MALIDKVKHRLGIFYSTTEKDAEVQGMIDAAVLYLKNAGWAVIPQPDENGVTPDPDALAVEAIMLYCKMAQSTDPSQLTNHPVFIAMLVQGRAANAET